MGDNSRGLDQNGYPGSSENQPTPIEPKRNKVKMTGYNQKYPPMLWQPFVFHSLYQSLCWYWFQKRTVYDRRVQLRIYFINVELGSHCGTIAVAGRDLGRHTMVSRTLPLSPDPDRKFSADSRRPPRRPRLVTSPGITPTTTHHTPYTTPTRGSRFCLLLYAVVNLCLTFPRCLVRLGDKNPLCCTAVACSEGFGGRRPNEKSWCTYIKSQYNWWLKGNSLIRVADHFSIYFKKSYHIA